jgi:hypothetical protein
MHRILRFAALMIIFFLWPASGTVATCGAASARDAETAFVDFRQLAVMPIFAGSRRPDIDEAMDKTLSCTVEDLCAGAREIDSGASRSLTRMVYETLRRKFGAQVVSLDRSQLAFAEVMTDESSETPRILAQGFGRKLDADYVVVGTVWRFRDRGQVPGVPDSPASVAFALYLVNVKNGRRLWRGFFDETQRPLTDNLLQARQSLKMGVKWLSARELARLGVEQVMTSFPTDEKLRIPVPVR